MLFRDDSLESTDLNATESGTMGYTVLIVDDSDIIRSVLEKTLRMSRLPLDEVLTACNGKEALEKLNDNWVDIVFTDIHMPEMSGVELIDAMNSDAELSEIPVIIVSTEGSAARIEELKSKGVRAYLRKPFTPESIRVVVVDTLGEWDA